MFFLLSGKSGAWTREWTGFPSLTRPSSQSFLKLSKPIIGVHWAGVEPVRGQYNQTYLDITHSIIKKLEDNNIYTLIDQHQDVWAAQICGHGAPLVNPQFLSSPLHFTLP